MDEERNEDLNPRSDDIEEKVRRMLDPNIPDELVQEDKPAKAVAAKLKKSIKVSVSPETVADTPSSEDGLPSAPELPGLEEKSPAKSKKIIVPIKHDDADADVQPADIKTAPEVKKITIADHNESTSEVAEKLNEAIADLGHDSEDSVEPEPSDDNEAVDTNEDKADILDASKPVGALAEEASIAEPAIIANPETDKAVEDIVAKESDKLIEVEDALRDTDEPIKPVKKPRRSLAGALKALWSKRAFRTPVLALLFLGIITAGAMPESRYFVLNTTGVRASSSLVVLDESTQQPLKNVAVKIGDVSGTTNEEGKVSLKKIKHGPAQLSIQKRAFAPFTKDLIIGMGSNPLGDFGLVPTGSQYSFTVTDFLSGKPVNKIEASSGESSAVSDEKGIIKLTIDKSIDEKFSVTLKGGAYRNELIELHPDDKTIHEIKLVPGRKHIYVSNRSGKYDVYGSYIDGKDEKIILAGNGSEKEGMVLVPHPSDNTAAYISTRDNKRNNEGFLLSSLILIDTNSGKTTDIVGSERIQIVSWSGDRLIYVQIAAGSSANSPKRFRLMAYHSKDNTNKELAASNFFNDVIAVNDAIYYAPSSAYQTGQPGFYKINADGSEFQTIFNQEVWNIFRTSYDSFVLSVQQQWYSYNLGDKAPVKSNSAPANQISRVYINSPEGKRSAWIDVRDGKGVLLEYDAGTKTDKTLQSQSGLNYPIQWLNDNVLVYRIKTGQETADYALNTEGGQPVKIKDVTASGGIDRWYYH